jgi:hypothetical protein
MRRYRRRRRYVGSATLTLAGPVLRYSIRRDAYVLRVVGRRFGPVLRHRSRLPRAHPPLGRPSPAFRAARPAVPRVPAPRTYAITAVSATGPSRREVRRAVVVTLHLSGALPASR